MTKKQNELEGSKEELEAQTEDLTQLARDLEVAKNELEAANLELERNSRLFRVLAENANDSISLRKVDGEYFYFSPSSEKVSGYTVEELFEIGDIKYLLTPEYQAKVDDLRKAIDDGTVKLGEPMLLRVKRKDGALRWFETTVSVVPGIDDPNVPDIMTASHDVTELVESREELRKLTAELEQAKLSAESNLEVIKSDIDLARAMQQAIVPRSFPSHPKYNAHAIMEAARQVGGDFYDFYQLDENRVGLAIGDVSGKGVSAAFFMAISRTLLETAAKTGLSPAAVLQDVNHRLVSQNPLFLFVTMFYGVLDLETGKFVYSNGGHNPPLVLRKNGTVDELPLTEDRMLGIMEDVAFHEAEVDLEHEDVLFLFTDGITEAVDHELSLFGDDRLKQHLSALAAESPRTVVTAVKDKVLAFAGDVEQSDDLTCMALQFTQPVSPGAVEHDLSGTAGQVDPNATIRIEMVNDVQQIVSVQEQLALFLSNQEIPEDVQFQVSISLEEYVVNLISYAYQDGERHMIHITATCTQKDLVIEVCDTGAPFNPLTVPEADFGSTLEDRQVGGLGVHIIRSYMDQLVYASRDGTNVFTMRKNLT